MQKKLVEDSFMKSVICYFVVETVGLQKAGQGSYLFALFGLNLCYLHKARENEFGV